MPIDRISHLVAPTPDEIQGRHRSFFRSFLHFLTSNLGLVIIVVAYCVGGAFLFILLEQYIELQNCEQANLIENISVVNISESMYNYIAITSDDTATIYDELSEYLQNFTNDIYDRKNNFRYTGQDCSTTSGWTFPSALLFTITVVTSIGYGHITPTSWEGQITCICYALIGIPIFLLCLANISSILGDMFRFMYSTFLHGLCCCCRIYTRSRRRREKRRGHEGQSYDPHGASYVGATSVDPNWPEADNHYGDDKLSDVEDDIHEEIDDVWSRMESRVPILAVILIIIGYICLGAIMFSKFEGWSMTESIYFCYITLSTIGFGDYVPGITAGSTDGLRFLACSLYIITGLAVLAMCFDLIKESIVDKFEWMGYKLGIVAEEDDQVDTDHTRYAKFEYAQQHEMNEKRPVKKTESYDPPPAYDYESPDGTWLKDVRDKVAPITKYPAKN